MSLNLFLFIFWGGFTLLSLKGVLSLNCFIWLAKKEYQAGIRELSLLESFVFVNYRKKQ